MPPNNRPTRQKKDRVVNFLDDHARGGQARRVAGQKSSLVAIRSAPADGSGRLVARRQRTTQRDRVEKEASPQIGSGAGE